MTEVISNVAQFLFMVWMLVVAPICTGIVVGVVLPETLLRLMQWREARKAKAAEPHETPGSPGSP